MSHPKSLDFAVQVENGRGVLVLGDRMFFDWLLVERLELEIPATATPLDVAGGATRFQQRRCRAAAARFVVDADGVTNWIETRADALSRAGFHGVRVNLRSGLAELTGRARIGEDEAEFFARVFVEPGERGVRFTLVDARAFGALPMPAHLVVHDVLCVLFAVPRWSDADDGQSARVIGLGDLVLRPLDAFLWNVLPPAGWRLPDASDVHAHGVKIAPTLVAIAYSSSNTGVSSSATRPRKASAYLDSIERHRELDELILRDEFSGAEKGLAKAVDDHPQDARFLSERLLALAAAKGDAKSLERLANDALSHWPDFAPAHMALAVLALRGGKGNAAAKSFQAVAQAAKKVAEHQEAVLATMAAAGLLTDEPNLAADLYGQVLRWQPEHAEAGACVMDALVRAQEWEKLVAFAKQPAFAAMVTDRISELLDDDTRSDDVFAALTSASAESIDDELLFLRADLFDERRKYREMAADLATLRERAERRGDLEKETRVCRRLAALTLERLHDDAGAVPLYQRALVIDPDDVASAEALTAIHQRSGASEQLKDALEVLLTITRSTGAGPAAEANVLRDLARASRTSKDLPTARAYLVDATRVAPHDMRTRRLAAEVAEEMGDHVAAAAELDILARTLAGLRGPKDAELEDVYLKLAQLREARSGDSKENMQGKPQPHEVSDAAPMGEPAARVDEAPGLRSDRVTGLSGARAHQSAILTQARNALSDGNVDGALTLARASLVSGALQPSEQLEAHLVAGDAYAGKGDLGGARVSFEEAHALQRTDARPIEALLQIAEAQDDWEFFADLLGRQIRIEHDAPYRARLWYQRAITYRDFLQREPEAYRAFKEAFACDPEFVEAAQALRAIAMARGEWSLVADLLLREIQNASEPIEEAGLHVELALIYEQRLLDIESAISNYEAALALDPEGPVPPGALARLYALTQRYEKAADAEEKAAYFDKNPAARADRLLRSGEHYERVGKLVEARRMYELAVSLPSGGDASSAAKSKLGRLEKNGAAPEQVHALLRSRLAKATDGKEKIGYLRQLLANSIAADDDVEIDLLAKQTLELDPDDVSAFQARRRIASQKEDWKLLSTLYRERARAVEDPHDKATLYFELGRVCFKRLGDLVNAELALEEVLAHDSKHLGALELLADLAYRRENWDKARRLYAQLDPSTSTMGRDAMLFRRGELAEVDGDTTGAESAYKSAVFDNPSNLAAHEALARLALYRGDVTRAINALTEMLELIPLDDVGRVTTTRQQLGELTHKAGDATAARFYFELVLTEDHSRVAAMMPLVDIYSGQSEWQKAADMLGRLSYLVKTPQKRTNLLYRMGEIYRVYLDDEERASDAYLRAIDLDAKHVPTLRRLIDHYWRVGDTNSLEEIVVDLEEQNELLVDGTQLETIARIGVSTGIAGNKKRASQMGHALGTAGAGALAATLAEAFARDSNTVKDVISVAHLLCEPPGPFLAAVRQVLEVRGQKDPLARDLAAKL